VPESFLHQVLTTFWQGESRQHIFDGGGYGRKETHEHAHCLHSPRGRPLPVLGDPGHRPMVELMNDLRAQLPRPDAILVISAHWEEPVPTVLGAEQPPMLYDYYGFPEEAYRISYPAPGHPALAERIAHLLQQAGLAARVDRQRGFDHGLFVPLMLLYPEADIPCLQLSLVRGLDPSLHIAMGKALCPLREKNILVVGSGYSFHNLRALLAGSGGPDPANDAFQDWLIETCTGPLSEEERERRLMEWQRAPHARYCHPREEHLLPLHVCQGIAGTPAQLLFDGQILGKRTVAFMW